MEVNQEEVHVERNRSRSEDESSQGRSEVASETSVRQIVPLQTLRNDYDERMEPLLAKMDALSKEVKRLRKRRSTKRRSRSSESESSESRRRESRERRHKESRKRKYRREDSSSECSEEEKTFWNGKR